MRAPAAGRGRAPAALVAALVAAWALAVSGTPQAHGGPTAPAAVLAQDAAAAPSSSGASPDGAGQSLLPTGLDPASARRVTVARLASADAALDDSLVVFRGEAVGEAVSSSSPGYRWVLVQSASGGRTFSIEVLMSVNQVSQISSFGSYKQRGSTVEVTGVYRIADPNQVGTLDVTAYAVRVVDAGGPVAEDVSAARVRAGLALAAAGLALSAANIALRRRSRS